MSPEEEEEPASPGARLMQAPGFNLCILAILGFKTRIDVNLFIQGVHQTLLKHPRFSSLLVTSNEKTGNYSWRRITSVDLGNHVFALDLDPDMESPDEFVEDFMSGLSRDSMDPTKPLWEFHILNVKTSNANSTVIFRTHHSMGDGVSLISLILACAQKMTDPKSLPVLPSKKRELVHNDGLIKRLFFGFLMIFSVIFNTLSDLLTILATILFLKDTKTPIKGDRGIELSRKRFVHRIISLDDVKLVKNAMNNVSINDIMLGVTEAGVGRYLNMIYAEKHIQSTGEEGNVKKANSLPKNLRIRSAIAFNLRPSPTIKELAEIMEKGKELNGMWGNIVGFALFPLTIGLQEQDDQDDPLACIRRAKVTMDRKKLSFAPKCSYLIIKLLIKLLGVKVAGALVSMLFGNTTLGFSNVAGPREEVTLFGHPLSYIAPSVSGFPLALVIHFQSYANKLIISIAADENLIPNPHKLCDDFVSSLQNIKETVIKNGIFKGSKVL